MAESVRTCVGCRRTDRREALVRVARGAAGVTADVRRRMPGRGAWLHHDPACWSGARGGLARTLRASVTERDLARVISTMETLTDPARAERGATTSDSGLLRRNAVDIATRSKAQD